MFLLVFWNLRKYNLLQVWIRTNFCTGMGLLTVNKNKLCRSRNITENAKKKNIPEWQHLNSSIYSFVYPVNMRIKVLLSYTIIKPVFKASGLIILTNNLFLDILAKKVTCVHTYSTITRKCKLKNLEF